MDELETAKAQLLQVEAVLAEDPENEQFLQLKADILQLIALTPQNESATKPSSEQELEQTEENTPSDEAQSITKVSQPASSQPDESSRDEEEGDEGVGGDWPSSTLALGKFTVGDIVEVVSAARPFAAVVQSVDSASLCCSLKYYGYDQSVQIPWTDIRPLHDGQITAKSPLLVPGLKCMAKYGEDQDEEGVDDEDISQLLQRVEERIHEDLHAGHG